MPIYEYACAGCAHEFETIQKMSDEPLEFCPECGKQELAKKISAAAFHLKGTGWYETDFKDKKKTSGDDDKGGKDATGDKDKAKGDKKDSASGSQSDGGSNSGSDSSSGGGSSGSSGSDSGSSSSSSGGGSSSSSSDSGSSAQSAT